MTCEPSCSAALQPVYRKQVGLVPGMPKIRWLAQIKVKKGLWKSLDGVQRTVGFGRMALSHPYEAPPSIAL